MAVHARALVGGIDLLLRLLGPRPNLLLSLIIAVGVFHGIFPSFTRIVVVRAKNDGAVNGVELCSAKLRLIRFRVIERLLHVVSEPALVALLALLLLPTRD